MMIIILLRESVFVGQTGKFLFIIFFRSSFRLIYFFGMSNLLSLSSAAAAVLRRAGFSKAQYLVTGTRRDGNRTKNLYGWLEGFRFTIDEDSLKLEHKMDYPWSKEAQEKIAGRTAVYREKLEAERFRCFINQASELVVVERVPEIESSDIPSGELFTEFGTGKK